MQFVEDYSEPQPSVFYQMPQSESIYEQRNKRFQDIYGFNDSFSSTDSVHEPLQPPALPPKQRQLVRKPPFFFCTQPKPVTPRIHRFSLRSQYRHCTPSCNWHSWNYSAHLPQIKTS